MVTFVSLSCSPFLVGEVWFRNPNASRGRGREEGRKVQGRQCQRPLPQVSASNQGGQNRQDKHGKYADAPTFCRRKNRPPTHWRLPHWKPCHAHATEGRHSLASQISAQRPRPVVYHLSLLCFSFRLTESNSQGGNRPPEAGRGPHSNAKETP